MESTEWKIGGIVKYKGEFRVIFDIDYGYKCLALDGDKYISPNHVENRCVTAPMEDCTPVQ